MNNLKLPVTPLNMFIVNPDMAGGRDFLLNNNGSSFYDACKRKSIADSQRLHLQGSYVWGKALANGSTAAATISSSPTRCAIWA